MANVADSIVDNANDLIVAGLPATGKTTYIAAFWHVANAADVQEALVLAELQPSRDHLNELARRWRNCEKMRRTSLGNEQLISLNLKDTKLDKTFRITLPDASGESFRRMFELRRWSPTFSQLVQRTGMVMFFLHPSGMQIPARIESVQDLVEIAQREEEDVEIEESNRADDHTKSIEELPKWRPALASPQSKVVDLLQLISRARRPRHLQFAIVISAWDLVEQEGRTPEEWVEKTLPLVFQYLDAHKTNSPFKIFGISAQGSDYKKDAVGLRESIRASDRIKVVEGNSSTHDITLPVRWLLSRTQVDV